MIDYILVFYWFTTLMEVLRALIVYPFVGVTFARVLSSRGSSVVAKVGKFSTVVGDKRGSTSHQCRVFGNTTKGDSHSLIENKF